MLPPLLHVWIDYLELDITVTQSSCLLSLLSRCIVITEVC